MNRIYLLITIITITAAGLFLTGCGGCHRFCFNTPEKRADHAVKKIAGELDLTDEQRSKLNTIKDEVLVKFKEVSSDRRAEVSKVQELIKSDKLNAQDVDKVISDHEAKFKTLKPFITEKIMEFHAMLTSEQRNQLADLIEEMYKRHHGDD